MNLLPERLLLSQLPSLFCLVSMAHSTQLQENGLIGWLDKIKGALLIWQVLLPGVMSQVCPIAVLIIFSPWIRDISFISTELPPHCLQPLLLWSPQFTLQLNFVLLWNNGAGKVLCFVFYFFPPWPSSSWSKQPLEILAEPQSKTSWEQYNVKRSLEAVVLYT